MFMVKTEFKIIMLSLSSELYTEFHHEMSNKCHDQTGHRKNQKEIFMIQYWNIMRLRSG